LYTRMCVPVEEHLTRVWYYHYLRPRSGFERAWQRAVYRAFHRWIIEYNFSRQDERVMLHQRYDTPEKLSGTDAEVIQWRRLVVPAAAPGAGVGFWAVSFGPADGVRLPVWLIPGRVRTTLLYSHGNAGSVGDRVAIAHLLTDQRGVGVFMYDYRGYGRSEGAPTEAGLLRDARAAREVLLREGVTAEHVVYLGRSLGA